MDKRDLVSRISSLKEEKNAIVLAHNYQRLEVQDIADFVGDSLELAMKSSEVKADVIVFAGVDFMAETAAILNPDKNVLITDPDAKCPMAAQLPAQLVREAKKKHPDAAVVLYVNTSAEARAVADVTCTSANAAEVVNALDEDKVLFGPDRNLAWFVQKRTKKKVIPLPDYGYCYVHRIFSPGDIMLKKKEHPDAEVLVHPECEPGVQDLADHICSTSQMVKRVMVSPARRFIIATEVGMVERLRRDYPDRDFIPALENAICEQMKRTTLEKIYESLAGFKHVVKVPDDIAKRARAATERMIRLTRRISHG
ncbi:MAG: quinolinate synthase NadA [Candidatus Hadarchaeales archaeon]